MKILVTGANGFLGQHLCLYLANQQYEVIALGRGERKLLADAKVQYQAIELTSKDQVNAAVSLFRPDFIVHTAAMSKPDECNNNKAACLANNVEATSYLVDAANASGSKFMYVSTDFVFGEGGPHAEEDAAAPLNFYGESKWMAEKLVAEKAHHFSIMRPVFIYGKAWQGMRPTFLHWVKNNLEQDKPIKVVNDQLRTPTHVQDLCFGIDAMMNKDVSGIYHLAGRDVLSPYQMALTVADVLGLDKTLIEPVTAETFPEPVKRAKRSGLKIDKAINELGYNPMSFDKGVRETFDIV